MHKVHALGFPLARVRDGLGTAPLPPPSPDFLTAMGRTNDAILFGGEVQLFVTGPEAEARDLAQKLPSSASRDYRQAVRPDLRGRRARLLQDRPDAVQPGASDGDLPRQRPNLRRRAARARPPRPVLR